MPVDLRMESAKVNGIDLAYHVRGEGPPLLLIHGTGVPASTWPAKWVSRLSDERRVIMFDYRGTGDTPASQEQWTTRDIGRDCTELLRELGEHPADVLGHSMGGRVAQWIALDHPEMVRSLILDSSGPGEFGGEFPIPRGIPLHIAVEIAEMGLMAHVRYETETVGFTPDYLKGPAEGFHELVDEFEKNPTTVENYLRTVVARQLHQTAGLLRDISVPTLVLVGDHETTKGGTGSHIDQAEYMARMIPGAEFRILEDLAHYHFWQDPDRTADLVLDWLRSVPAGP